MTQVYFELRPAGICPDITNQLSGYGIEIQSIMAYSCYVNMPYLVQEMGAGSRELAKCRRNQALAGPYSSAFAMSAALILLAP